MSSTSDISGTPLNEAVRCQCSPPSRVTWIRPSSVPTYIRPSTNGLSSKAIRLPYIDVDRFLAMASTLQTRPMTSSLLRSILRDRSPLTATQLSPRSSERNRRSEP